MADTISVASQMQTRASAQVSQTAVAATVPWYVWSCLIAVICSVIGGAWDISWHESIGRDTFWTTPHLLIQLCGIISGLCCGYLILSTTFQKDSPLRPQSISMWGFRGPMGAFLCAWGGVAMITSAPFDNWWHAAYGLDVKILSPPHVLLALGMMGIRFGTVIMIISEMNRAQGEHRARLQWLLFFAFIFIFGMTTGIAIEYTLRIFMHGATFYFVAALIAPILFAAIAAATKHPWAATITTAMYTATHLAFTWILPLFPAEPKLGPVYQKITHLIPPDFPLLLIVPAIVFDLLRHRIGGWNRWAQAGAQGVAYLVSFAAVQWPFADFLMSPASRTWFFATNNFPYFVRPASPWATNVFFPTEATAAGFWIRMFIALLTAIVMTELGTRWGEWMSHIRR
jgi:hypothetical protein